MAEDSDGAELLQSWAPVAAGWAPAGENAHEWYARGLGGQGIVNIVSEIECVVGIATV